jgi:hypothetical protein
MTTLEILKAARKLITPKGAWITGVYAKTSPKGRKALFGNDPAATCWCMEGALQKASGREMVYDSQDLLKPFGNIGKNLPQFNDAPGRTHAEVLAAFDAAIAKLESGAYMGKETME